MNDAITIDVIAESVALAQQNPVEPGVGPIEEDASQNRSVAQSNDNDESTTGANGTGRGLFAERGGVAGDAVVDYPVTVCLGEGASRHVEREKIK